jgi:hypothetical protein
MRLTDHMDTHANDNTDTWITLAAATARALEPTRKQNDEGATIEKPVTTPSSAPAMTRVCRAAFARPRSLSAARVDENAELMREPIALNGMKKPACAGRLGPQAIFLEADSSR